MPPASTIAQSALARWEWSGWEQFRRRLLDTQSATYWGNLLRLDLGDSHVHRLPVFRLILARLPISITLAISSLIIAYLVSIPLGIWSAVGHRTRREQGFSAFLLMLYSLPAFFTATMLPRYLPHPAPRRRLGRLLQRVRGGEGPPVLLLHGYPQTHLVWRHLAPTLARELTVIAPDLKGYGDSDAPAPDPSSSRYSKRAMAADHVALMRALNHERFLVVGHDRGARIGYCMALDHADRVRKLATFDIVPTGAMWEAANRVFAVNTFHWGFLAQAGGLPEKMIGADPDFWVEAICRKWARNFKALEDAMPEYKRCFRRPEVIAASCADYRAGATPDDTHDRTDLDAGRKLDCPVLAVSSGTFVGQGKSGDPMQTWRRFANDVRGFPVDCGHFIPEEAPGTVEGPLLDFLRR